MATISGSVLSPTSVSVTYNAGFAPGYNTATVTVTDPSNVTKYTTTYTLNPYQTDTNHTVTVSSLTPGTLYSLAISATYGSATSTIITTAVPPTWTDNVLSTTFQVGTAYSDSVAATNMNYSGVYSSNGVSETNSSGGSGTGYYQVLPGVFLNKSTGTVTGTPTTPGNYSFTIVATNVNGSINATFSMTVVSAPVYPPVWTASTLSDFIVNKSYTSTLTATNMNYSGVYSVSSGSLPTGISFNTATGALTGTPTIAQPYSFSITATNTYGLTTLSFSGNVYGGVSITSGTSTKSTVKVYNGATWALGTVYVYNGTTWVVSK